MHDLPGAGRVVAPLVPLDQSLPPAKYLNPVITLDGKQFVLIIQSMAAVRVALLGSAVGDLSDHQDEITRAIDMVFQGFC
ncbi:MULTISPECIES: CcdB family protein [Roseobacteraceae]|uniref:CcdB family protein n=1 Tax=Roseobacteraceae TaxID=2854170 RepID=UPI0012FD84C3|nr:MULTISPECIES: CcdB family protein [Roseobacteraceae]